MRFAPHYIEACQTAQPPRPETRHHTLSSVELGLVAELEAQGRLGAVSDLLARRDASGEARPSLVSALRDLPDLPALLARQARFLQIEAEALFAALLVRDRIASVEWVMHAIASQSTWLGVALVRENRLAEADLPWLFEDRRLLQGRAQAWQAEGFLSTRELAPWLLCPRDPSRSAIELLRLAIPRAVSLLEEAGLDAAPARPSEVELPYEGLVFGYRILQRISQGSRGVVYRARHLFTQREVALKVIPLRHPNNFGRAVEFWREAVAMSRVEDPRVVTAYDFGGCKDYYYYASELLHGRLLKDVDRTTLSTSTLLGCSRDVALALGAIRDAGLVHRDVIPSNVLLGDDGITRLLDYGDVWFHSDVRVPGRGVPGTIPYVAPEEVQATTATDPSAVPSVDERSDQYMLGVVLFELLAGRRLFEGGEHEFKDWVQTASVPALRTLVAELAPELDQLVERMTRREPEARFPSLEELIRAIDRITGFIGDRDTAVGAATGCSRRETRPS